MFAVKGWSVPASALKTQTLKPAKSEQTPVADGASNEAGPAGAAGQKRKRASKDQKQANVSEANVADLYASVIEKDQTPKGGKAAKAKPSEKRQKVTQEPAKELPSTDAKAPAATEVADAKPAAAPAVDSTGAITLSERGQKRKTMKDKKREKKAKANAAPSTDEPTETHTISAPAPAKIQPKLTPLQASMRQKLVSARFRHLNQTLYTTPSAHSLSLFSENPEMFHEYHEGFRRQVEVWPENPVDTYIAQIRTRGKVAANPRGKGEHPDTGREIDKLPLPRTVGTCYIADLGCGDAKLTQALEKEKKALKVQVFSYDLQNPSPFVTKADISNLPLEDNSCDVAIFCLALMGTNWVDFIEEAYRILHWKGELWIAEIKSRFGRVGGAHKRVEHSVGNRKKPAAKAAKKMDEDADNADLLVEVDGHDDTKAETDVSAFVEVLRKRGFVLQGEKAVDLSNRMFVKMTFVKALAPMKGKCVPVPKGMEKMGQTTWKPKAKPKFLEEEDVPVSSEAGVLKPCVYKLR
ncbi:25S rRNA (adenine645-N1)-methyltransferase [Pseudogymnoascus verrucosus]|uniref:Ribosomal RNA-processing protein 8 n=1 Tax=Pseudogymnoascus verrucosus TaxID=342668 RepID=A0A1B8GMG4_9PEZI|nr:25S rRNA (adenine645-N1)-methyltransferase [Pseudogymnoascus verrucosus]OBT97034.1 25S rRNA (adenine645-N1)-methyltransferase [Pseudogymnoascus verrucosus]